MRTSSQQSIQKVVSYALKYHSRCGEDLWDCLVEECQKGTINARINILYLLDSLCDASLLSKANSASSTNTHGNLYTDYVSRDLSTIVEYVVPEDREGLINLMSAVQILENWKNKRIIDPHIVGEVITKLKSRKAAALPPDAPAASIHSDKNEIVKRIEEDRERHKRLRERRWVQPISHNPSANLLSQLATFMPETEVGTGGEAELTIDIEFDNEWETTSDWNEDDDEAAAEENKAYFPLVQHSQPAMNV